MFACLFLLAVACRPEPAANFTVSVTEGPAPLEVRFSDLSTGSPTAWQWDFGDGGTSSERNPTHTFTVAGTHRVILQASKGTTMSEQARPFTITVGPGPLDRITLLPDSAKLNPQGEQSFSMSAFDPFGNPVHAFAARWQAAPEAGA